MCLHCRTNLPLTGFHLNPSSNELRDKLNGLTAIDRAVAYFHYERLEPHGALIHEAKYRGRPRIFRELAQDYSRELIQTDFFNGIDAIVPVPLEFFHECRRGYNQSAWIARGISDVTDLPIIDALRARRHKSQTRKNAAERQHVIEGVYTARSGALNGFDHVLLVDDLATTGSTIYACAKALRKEFPQVTVSVLALASTRRI